MEYSNCVSSTFAYQIYISKWLNCFESVSQCGVFCNLGLMFKMPGIYKKKKNAFLTFDKVQKKKIRLLPSKTKLQVVFLEMHMAYITINI